MVGRRQIVLVQGASVILVVLGVLLVVLSTVFVSSFLAVLGLGLVFWGCVLFYVSPVRHVPFDLVEAAADVNAGAVERVLVELDLVEKGVYLPPKNLKDIESSLVFVPFSQAIPASVEEIIPPPPEPPTEEYTNKTTATTEAILTEPIETPSLEVIPATESLPLPKTDDLQQMPEAPTTEQELIPEEATFEKTAKAAEPASETEGAVVISDVLEKHDKQALSTAIKAEILEPDKASSVPAVIEVVKPEVAAVKPVVVPGVVKVVKVESVSATAVTVAPTGAVRPPSVRYSPSGKSVVETGFAAVFDSGIDTPEHDIIGKSVRTKVEGDVGCVTRRRNTASGPLVSVEFKWIEPQERIAHGGLTEESVWFWEDEVEVVEPKPEDDLSKLIDEAINDLDSIGEAALKELEDL